MTGTTTTVLMAPLYGQAVQVLAHGLRTPTRLLHISHLRPQCIIHRYFNCYCNNIVRRHGHYPDKGYRMEPDTAVEAGPNISRCDTTPLAPIIMTGSSATGTYSSLAWSEEQVRVHGHRMPIRLLQLSHPQFQTGPLRQH